MLMPGRRGAQVGGGWAQGGSNGSGVPQSLTLESRDASVGEYKASQEITFEPGFGSPAGDEFLAEITQGNSTGGSGSGGFSTTAGGYRYGFNGKEWDSEIKGDGNQISFEARVYDSRVGQFLSMDPIANRYPFQNPYVFAGNSPIALVDILGMGPGDPLEHKVVKGDNLTKISKKFGVSIKDLMTMNNIGNENMHKLSVGQILLVNPEANFSKNPRGGYRNPDNEYGDEKSVNHIGSIGVAFATGDGDENMIITGGGALSSIQSWKEVQNRLSSSLLELKSDGKLIPGEVAFRDFSAGSLLSNIKKGFSEAWQKFQNGEDPWKNNSQNSPIHVIGSFTMTVRVNANGTTATVCVYDSKSFKSLSDNTAGSNANRRRKTSKIKVLTTTYQRYIWNVNL